MLSEMRLSFSILHGPRLHGARGRARAFTSTFTFAASAFAAASSSLRLAISAARALLTCLLLLGVF